MEMQAEKGEEEEGERRGGVEEVGCRDRGRSEGEVGAVKGRSRSCGPEVEVEDAEKKDRPTTRGSRVFRGKKKKPGGLTRRAVKV